MTREQTHLTVMVFPGTQTLPLFAAQTHENHLYLAVPFLVLAAGLDRRYRPTCWAASAILSLNLVLFYGFGRGLPHVLYRSWTVIDASVLLAFVSIGVFVTATKVMVVGRIRERPSSTSRVIGFR